MNNINISLAADNNYASYMGVTMTSILANAKSTTFCKFYLLVPSDFSNRNITKMNALKRQYPNCEITFIDMKDAFNYQNQLAHLTYQTYYRLMLADLIPTEDKCIYFDCDIIVNEDLTEYYNLDITGNYIAGVVTLGTAYAPKEEMQRHADIIGIPDRNQYINAGAVIFNLKEIRKDNLIPKFVELAKKEFPIVDQDVVNSACYNKIKCLDYKYNVMTSQAFLPDDMVAKRFENINELHNARINPVIIHYCDAIKPWSKPDIVLGEYWWNYARISSYYEEILYKEIDKKLLTERNDLKLVIAYPSIRKKYLRYKLFSVITIGKTRKKYMDKKQNYKSLINKIKKIIKE